ncbi:MAG TPA: DbpA RNA binding domain-containing protein [Gemmatimonadaceae bacterium]
MEQHGRITEHEERETASVGRSQNVVHILPHDMTSAAAVLTTVLDRLDRDVAELQLVLLTPDPDAAIALARAVASLPQSAGLRVIPASSPPRAARLLRARPVHGVIGAPADLLELVRTSVLKLEHVRGLVLAWVDEIVDDAASREALEAVLAEIPKDAARTIIASRQTPEVEQLVERYARRARRVGDTTGAATATPIRYLSTSPWGRLPTLQRVLDELDPEIAAVFTRAESTEREVRELLESLGHAGDEAGVRVTRGAPVIEADTLVLLDLPTREELRAVMGGATPSVVAIVQPRQLDAVRALAGGAPVTPLRASGAPTRARQRVAALRSELRDVLANGIPTHELLALEPLLDEYDGVEVAAAALRLLERARARDAVRTVTPPPAAATGPTTGWTRIFVGAGTRDRVGPGDLVGAITGEAGITRESIGKIELRENHALVEIASADAERVATALTGTMVRGRRVVARVDKGREPRGDRGDRADRGGRGDRSPRGFRPDRGDRGPRDRGERPDRGPRRARGDVERRRPPATDAE